MTIESHRNSDCPIFDRLAGARPSERADIASKLAEEGADSARIRTILLWLGTIESPTEDGQQLEYQGAQGSERYLTVDLPSMKGAQGTVSVAYDRQTLRWIVRKYYNSESSAFREAAALRHLCHESLPVLLDFTYGSDVSFGGETFAAAIATALLADIPQRGPVTRECLARALGHPGQEPRFVPSSLHEAIGIVLQIASALAKCHAAGVYHRDVKEDNIVVTPQSHKATLIDFGCADQIHTDVFGRTRTVSKVGTQGYMAPEVEAGSQLLSASGLAQADIFSLGVVMVNLIASYPTDHDKTEYRGTQDRLVKRFDRIADRATRSERAERYHSADDLVSDLKNLLADRRLSVETDGEWLTHVARIRWPQLVGAWVVIVLTIGGLLSSFTNDMSRREALRQCSTNSDIAIAAAMSRMTAILECKEALRLKPHSHAAVQCKSVLEKIDFESSVKAGEK